jgi:HK97 family phage major capsid protein
LGAYDAIISRTDAAPLIPEEVSYDILSRVPEQSVALSTFRTKNMGRKQVRIPVKSALPTAYFRNGDTGLRQTTEIDWTNKYLNAEEVDCIVPIPKTVVADVEMNIWDDVKPDIIEAIGLTIDAAILFGTNKPSSWDAAIAVAAAAASNTVTRTTASQATGGIAKDISDVMAKVEAQGLDVNAFIANRTLRSKFRAARDTTGQKLLDVSPKQIEDIDVKYGAPGTWPSGTGAAELFAGDATQGIIGVRQDLEWQILDQAVIQDNTGAIVYNLAQQGMVALMVTARFAWAVPNPINRTQPTEASRYPFGVLLAP